MKFRTLQLDQVSYSKTQLKQEGQQIKTEYGNLSTSRAKGAVIKQFIADDDNTYEKEQFKKMQDLEFQNGLFQMQMHHIHKRKNCEDFSIRKELTQIQQEILNIQNKVKLVKNESAKKLSSDSSSSSDSLILKPQLQNQDQILKNFKELFEVCNANDKLTLLAKQYCGSLQSVEIGLISQQYNQIIESLIKMIIDIIKKFNSIRIDSLKFKQGTPDKQQYNFEFGTFNKEQRKTLLTNESPAFQSTSELEEMKLKLSDHYDKIEIKKPQIIEPQRKSATSHVHKRIDLIPSLRGKAKTKQQIS